MKLNYEISQTAGRAVILAAGKGEFGEFVETMQRLVEEPTFSSDLDVLADLGDLDYTPSFNEIRKFASHFGKLRSMFGNRAAFVVKDTEQLKLGRFAALLAKPMRFDLGVFDSLGAASDWLARGKAVKPMETIEKIRAILSTPLLASLATIRDDGTPWVRYVMIVTDEELNLRFATVKGTRKISQIEKNPNVHLVAGVSSLQDAKEWLQIEGRAALSDASSERHKHWNDSLKAYFEGPDDPNYVVCIVQPTRIEYMQMNTMRPEIWAAKADK